jgi:hypothetical protein
MFSGPPLPLPHEFPLAQLLTLTQATKGVGAWVRGCARQLRLHPTGPGRCGSVLISGDLGLLLGGCVRVALREGAQPLVVEAEVLIQWRALQVVTGTPYLPRLDRLREIFPGALLDHVGFRVPIQSRPPEEVLADCLTHEIPVAGSQIIYCAPLPRPADPERALTPPRPAALDRIPPASSADLPPAAQAARA